MMALQEKEHWSIDRLSKSRAGCWRSTSRPARLVAIAPCVGDTDDLFLDALRGSKATLWRRGVDQRFLAHTGADNYRVLDTTPPPLGRAGTSLFVRPTNSVYISPSHTVDTQQAEIWVYKLGEPLALRSRHAAWFYGL